MSCNSQPFSFDQQFFFNNDCFSCQDNGCGNNVSNSRCVIYTGPNLSCSGIETNDSLETALQKLDVQICSAIGDYSTYQFNCLTAYWGSSITQESTFVDAITSYACFINDTLTTFTGTTFPAYQTTVDTRFDAIEQPGIDCGSAGVNTGDSLIDVLNKYCTKFGQIDTALDISAVTWDNCFTVPTPPTTIADGFVTVLDQICQLKAAGVTLPTFNNTGSCLPSPGSSDSLVSTIGKIKTRLCQTPTLDNTTLTSSCLSIPAGAQDLQTLLQSIIDKVDTFTQNAPSYSGDFTISPNGGPCDGITVALATPLNVDRFVASNNADSSPGTLQDKVTAGTGVTLDFITTPGQMIINATGTDNFTVKADTADDTPGYLDQKLEGGDDNGISLSIGYDAGSKKATITPAVDLSTLINNIITFISGDGDTLSALCNLIAPCIGANCITYSVDNSTGSSVNVTYTDCTTNTQTSVLLDNNGTIEVCAKFGTVVAAGCTITAMGNCTGGGGGGGTTVRVSNTLGGTSIDNVQNISGFTLSSPVGVGGVATGTHNAFSGGILVTISGTPVIAGNLTIEVNGTQADCVDVAAAGTFTLSAGPYLATDVIQIFLNTGSCT